MDRETILGLNADALKTKLTELGLGIAGRNRLFGHFGLNEADSGSEYDDVGSRQVATGIVDRHVFTQDSLSTFCGTDTLEIYSWIEDFDMLQTE